MTNPKSMDEQFLRKDLEDVFDWAKMLQMATKVQDYDEEKLFKLVNFNLRRKAKDWYRRLNLAPFDWQTLHTLMIPRCGVYDGKELRVKMDAIKQELKQ